MGRWPSVPACLVYLPRACRERGLSLARLWPVARRPHFRHHLSVPRLSPVTHASVSGTDTATALRHCTAEGAWWPSECQPNERKCSGQWRDGVRVRVCVRGGGSWKRHGAARRAARGERRAASGGRASAPTSVSRPAVRAVRADCAQWPAHSSHVTAWHGTNTGAAQAAGRHGCCP